MTREDQDYLGIAGQFRRVPYFPKDSVREMARLLKDHCPSVDVARRCAAAFLNQDTPEAPSEKQVTDWVYQNVTTLEDRKRLEVLRRSDICEECSNSGKHIVNIPRKNPATGNRENYEAVDFCGCEIGQVLRRMTQQREGLAKNKKRNQGHLSRLGSL